MKKQAEQIADQLGSEALLSLAYLSSISHSIPEKSIRSSTYLKLFTFNSLPFERKDDIIFADINIPTDLGTQKLDIEIIDAHTSEIVPHIILSEKISEFWYILHDTQFRNQQNINRYAVAFKTDVPAFGFSTFLVHYTNKKDYEDAKIKLDEINKKDDKIVISNGKMRVTIYTSDLRGGSCDIFYKPNKKEYKNLNVLMYEKDNGNVYHFSSGWESDKG